MLTKKILWLALVLSFALGLEARVWEVGPNAPLSSIKEAVVLAADGDEIVVYSGIYKEGNIRIDKSIHLRGVGYPVIDGENQTEILTIAASRVKIEGLQIQNVGTSYTEDRAGIKVQQAKEIIIHNNKLINTFFGVYLGYVNESEITDNEIIGQAEKEISSGNAIHLWYCKKIIVRGNLVRQHRDGIYLEFVDQSSVTENISEDNLRYGLHFMFSNDDDYFQNEFRRNGAGVAVMFSKKINMWENIFEYNWGKASYGLLLKEIYDAEILRNEFRENTIGIYMEGATRIKYESNNFISNGWAIKMSGGCLDNEVHQNNFISNSFDLSVNSAANNNSFDGNYWSGYSGYDLDKDGTGDVPHRPVKLFNYIVNKTPEATILLRSLFVDLINFSEKISPVFTPKNIIDKLPRMKPKPISHD